MEGRTGKRLAQGPAVHVYRQGPPGLPNKITQADGTHRLIVPGVPIQLAQPDPDNCLHTPWETYFYDPDDNAARTPGAVQAWLDNIDTPVSREIDALGRVVRVTERDGTAETSTLIHHDAAGNVVDVVDALGRTTYRAAYDLQGRAWAEWTCDAGSVLTVRDPLGAPLETRDARRERTLQAYDDLHRLVARWATSPRSSEPGLVESVAFGDSPSGPNDAAEHNLLGREWRRIDPAGVTEITCYDAHGAAAVTQRR